MENTFLIPLTKIKPSLSSHINFFYRHQNSYITDNHRLALWIIVQHLKSHRPLNLLHIDAHYDCAYGDVEDYQDLNLNLFEMNLDDFINQRTADKVFPLFRWDNYFKFLFDYHQDCISKKIFLTHQIGDTYPGITELKSEKLFHFLSSEQFQEGQWIVNLDMDYFFTQDELKLPLFSDEFIEELCRYFIKHPPIVLIIALSPECSGGFEKSYKMAQKFTSRLQIPFILNF